MVTNIQALAVQVDRPTPTYRKRIIERWGVSGGDVKEYHISVTGNHGHISVGRISLSCSQDVLVEIAHAIIEVVAAQSGDPV